MYGQSYKQIKAINIHCNNEIEGNGERERKTHQQVNENIICKYEKYLILIKPVSGIGFVYE